MRFSTLMCSLLLLAGVSSLAHGQPVGYCRVYRTMIMQDGTACFYCLKAGTCNQPVGYIADFTSTTGSCLLAGAHCVLAEQDPPLATQDRSPMGNASASDRAQVADAERTNLKLGPNPGLMYDPDYVTNVKEWLVMIDATDDSVDNPVKCLLVTLEVTPLDDAGKPHKTGYLGFARPTTSTDPPDGKAISVTAGGDKKFYFKLKENDSTVHNKKVCMVLFD